MRIRMYNVWFGDCFSISDDTFELIVDFGIHRQSIMGNGWDRSDIHEKVANDIVSSKKSRKLLITHFHEDHISGLLYMYNNHSKNSAYKHAFSKVYLPDIWRYGYSKYIIASSLLETILDSYLVEGKRKTLLDLIRFLVKDVKNVSFLSRGNTFHCGQYRVLWPDVNRVGVDIMHQYNDLFGGQDFSTRLLIIAQGICDLVATLDENVEGLNQDENSETKEYKMTQIEMLDEQLTALINEVDESDLTNDNEEAMNTYRIRLNSLNNAISIVFHDNLDRHINKHMLFTGDITITYMNDIYNNWDASRYCELHNNYHYIKIPHHGTKNHFFDFSEKSPRVYMFPNGNCRGHVAYKIDGDYIKPFSVKKLSEPEVYCSNCNWCAYNPGRVKDKCQCDSPNLVFPNLRLSL